MNRQALAIIIQEGSRILTQVIRNRAILFTPSARPDSDEEPHEAIENRAPASAEPQPTPGRATAIATGCIPCSIGHLGTCSGLLNEAMRFARKDGLESGEVIERINMCMDELNALERVDLRPEMIHDLPAWEKGLAEQALTLSRSLRHDLEGISDAATLEAVAANTQVQRQQIGKAWFQERLARMTPEQREKVKEELTRRVQEEANDDSG